MTERTLLILSLLTPLATALTIYISRKHENLRELSSVAGGIALLMLLRQLLDAIQAGHSPTWTAFQVFQHIPIKFVLEPLGLIFAMLASSLWILNSIYSIGYMRGNAEKHQTRFYLLVSLAIFCTMGIACAGNLLTLFIFYEGLTITTYPLIVHKNTEQAIQAGKRYLGMLLSTSIGLFLVAIIWVGTATGRLDFIPGGISHGHLDSKQNALLLLLFAYGIAKAALVPFHQWLPAAMVAPTPVSALLHAVAVVKAGVFSLLKIALYIFGIDTLRETIPFVLYIAGGTTLYASIIALRSDNLKRVLAYSTIAQLAYIIMAGMLFTPAALMAAAFHLVIHAVGKITLFFAAGSIYTVTGRKNISELAGIGHTMPLTMTAFAIAALSMIGIPPAAGFISKWYILQAAYTEHNWFVILVMVGSTLLTAAYFLPILYRAFFLSPLEKNGGEHGSARIHEAPLSMLIALGLTATMTFVLFICPEWLLNLTQLLIRSTG